MKLQRKLERIISELKDLQEDTPDSLNKEQLEEAIALLEEIRIWRDE